MRHKMMRDIPFETAVEYAVDFIELMGTPALYEEKTAVVEIDNWRGALPCDFNRMIQVRMAGKQHCSKWSGGRSVVTHPVYRASNYSFKMSEDIKPNAFEQTVDLKYSTQGMVIFTSTKDIDVEIAYLAFAVDDEGFPLLPDNASFLRGLESYIKMKWFEMKFDEGKLPQAVMERADREYCWAAGDAQSEFSRMSLDEAHTLFTSFKTILPRNNEYWKAFFTNGAR